MYMYCYVDIHLQSRPNLLYIEVRIHKHLLGSYSYSFFCAMDMDARSINSVRCFKNIG